MRSSSRSVLRGLVALLLVGCGGDGSASGDGAAGHGGQAASGQGGGGQSGAGASGKAGEGGAGQGGTSGAGQGGQAAGASGGQAGSSQAGSSQAGSSQAGSSQAGGSGQGGSEQAGSGGSPQAGQGGSSQAGGAGAAGAGGAAGSGPPPATCSNPAIKGTLGGKALTFQRLVTPVQISYFGDGFKTIAPTDFSEVFTSAQFDKPLPWPAQYGLSAVLPMPGNGYISLKFTVPEGYLESQVSDLYGLYKLNESAFSVPPSMTISTSCGDFSDPAAPGSTVIAGCRVNLAKPDGFLRWSTKVGQCGLVGGATYFLNIISADISGVTPGGGVAVSGYKDPKCQFNVCSTPLVNGPGTWKPPTP